jgi:hypothetical protein
VPETSGWNWTALLGAMTTPIPFYFRWDCRGFKEDYGFAEGAGKALIIFFGFFMAS